MIAARLSKKDFTEPLLDKFIRYVKIHTTSNPDSTEQPSSPGQWELAHLLEGEIKSLGIPVTVTEHAYVLATIPATKGFENVESLLLISHMDTAPDSPGANIKPQIIENYQGQQINGIKYDDDLIGDTLIVTDGTTLLGGDDKAGIAEIMTALPMILKMEHGPIEILFNPDEEIFQGMANRPPLKSVGGYTVDGEGLPEVNFETFNGIHAQITFKGISIHPGDSRNSMVNAVTMATAFIGMIPQSEMPEAADGRLGFFCPMSIFGSVEEAKVLIYLRDFDGVTNQKRVERLKDIAKAVEAAHPGGKVEIDAKLIYSNSIETIEKHPKVIPCVLEAFRNCGIKPNVVPIRGGTDSVFLAKDDIACANIFTGDIYPHSVTEAVALSHMVATVEILIEIVRIWSQAK